MKRHALIYFGVVFIHLLLAMCLKMKCVSFISSRFFSLLSMLDRECDAFECCTCISCYFHFGVIALQSWSHGNSFLLSYFDIHTQFDQFYFDGVERVSLSLCWFSLSMNYVCFEIHNLFKFSISVFNSSKEQLLEIHEKSHLISLFSTMFCRPRTIR